MGLDAQLLEQVEDGRRHAPVALEFDDGHVVQKSVVVGHDVVEAQVGVDGQPLRHALVHQGDAVEAILQLLIERERVVLQIAAQKLVVLTERLVLAMETDAMVWIPRVELMHQHALLLRPPVVVLRLHLQEVQPGVHIAPYAQLLPVGVAPLMGTNSPLFPGGSK